MAAVTDPTFGAAFDAATFRTVIRNTMTMGLPNTAAERATFRWTPVKTFHPEDPANKPYTWTETPVTDVEHVDVQVPVAVEFTARPGSSAETVMGEFDASKAVLTLLDVDYALVAGADLVLLGGNTYEVQFVAPPIGLFDVTVYQIYLVARDES